MLIPVNENPRYEQKMDHANRTHTFEIYNLQLDDSGVYKIHTPNLTVKTPDIQVIPKPGPKPTEEEIIPEQVTQQSSVTIDMKRPQEQRLYV